MSTVRANMLIGESMMVKLVRRLESIHHSFQRGGAGPDVLFEADYNHQAGCPRAASAAPTDSKERPPRTSGAEVTVHYGTIASGNQVIKSADERDRLSAELGGVLCFEMEAAGLNEQLPLSCHSRHLRLCRLTQEQTMANVRSWNGGGVCKGAAVSNTSSRCGKDTPSGRCHEQREQSVQRAP